MTRLIINADDFGLTHGVNRAVGELHEAGVLTSATLMANAGSFDDAVSIAQRLPALGVGCHVVLVDGCPVSEPSDVPTLIGPDGSCFHATLGRFVRALLLGRIDPDDIAREATAQIGRLLQAGIKVAHLDTHKHTHLFPAVLKPLLKVAKEHSIAAVRNPFEPAWSLKATGGGLVRRAEIGILGKYEKSFWKAVHDSGCATTDGALGILATGTLDGDAMERLLNAMPETTGQETTGLETSGPGNTWELVCHPGHVDDALHAVNTRLRRSREIERDALMTVFANLNLNHPGIELIHYRDLLRRPADVLLSGSGQVAGHESESGEKL